MCEESEQSLPVARLLGSSGFGDSFCGIDNAASDNINEVISLGIILMYNNAAICGGRIDMQSVVRYLSELWKYPDNESAMIVLVNLICWEYRDTSF